MDRIPYCDYVSYNMRTYFSRLPGDILRCPMCSGTLSKSDVAPSESVRVNLAEPSLIPWHEFSQVFTCRTCQWWCIREYWVLGELSGNGDRDYVIMGIAKQWNLLNKTLPLDILHTYFERQGASSEFTMGDAEALKNVIQNCLNSESHPCDVRHIGTGRDGDLFLIDDDNSWLVLIKRRWFDWAGPVEAIEFLNGVVDCEGECFEMLITGASPYPRLVHRVNDLPNEHVKPALKAMMADVLNSQNHPDLVLIDKIPTTKIKSWGQYFSLGLDLHRRVYRVHVPERSHLSTILHTMPEEQMHPWFRALQDVHVYDKALNLPDEFGSLFRV